MRCRASWTTRKPPGWRFGVDGVGCAAQMADPARVYATVDELKRARELCERHKLTMDIAECALPTQNVDSQEHPAINLGESPQRDRDIEGFQTHITGERETKRGTSDPTYLYCTLGKLEILKLREDYKKMRGSAYTLEEFHNNFLKQGMPPIKIVRKKMLGNDSPVL